MPPAEEPARLDVLLVTCADMPEPDVDEPLLLEALRARGISAAMASWNDPAVDWFGARIAMIRSTWDYHHHPDRFLAWLDEFEHGRQEEDGSVRLPALLVNPPDVVRWNAHKGYLRELEAAGVPIVPTTWIERGTSILDAAGAVRATGWRDVVVKPAVSAGSWATRRVDVGDAPALERALADVVGARDCMVQPWLASVEGHGERSITCVHDVPRHAIRKSLRLAGQHEVTSGGEVAIEPDELALAEQVLAAARDRTGMEWFPYARVDVAPGADGSPVLMELELIEPSLFLQQAPATIDALVDEVELLLEVASAEGD
jgi:hypothetical protein